MQKLFSLHPRRHALTLLLFCAAAFPVNAQNVQRWIHSGFSQDYADVQRNNEEWRYPVVLTNTDVVQMFKSDVYNQGANLPALRARLALYRKHGIRLAIEGDPSLNPDWVDGDPYSWYCNQPGVTCNGAAEPGTPGSVDDVARASAWRMLQRMRPIYDAGGEVSYLALGGYGIGGIVTGPEGAGRNCQFTPAQAYDALLKFMRYIHQGVSHHGDFQRGHPEIKMGLILATPTIWYRNIPPWNGGDPNYTPTIGGTDFGTILQEMITAVKQGGETLWFLHADSPYNVTVPSSHDYIGRLAQLRDQMRGLNVRFGIVFNTIQEANDQAYFDETLAFIDTYKQRFGDPDDFVVESWFHSPSQTFNEDTPLSFMNLVKTIAESGRWGYDHGNFRRTDRDIFDWRFYLSSYSDVASWVDQVFGNQKQFGAEYHWLNAGVNEGRRGAWMFSAPAYMSKYPMVADLYGQGNWPGGIDHFFRWGRTYDHRSARQSRISGGLMHSLVQRQFYAPKAAGQGLNGQLGNNGTSNSTTPVQVAAGFQTSDVTAGYYDSLAVATDGTLYVWGNNTYGQLGNNTTGSQANAPSAVPNFGNVITQSGDGNQVISANYGVCAAVDNTGREESGQFTKGRLWMWGINYDGQLGDGTTTAHYVPQLVLAAPGTPLSDVVSIAAGSSHTAALKRDGTVLSWGTNANGALGNGGIGTRSLYPVQVLTGPGQALNDVVQLACGGSRFCVAVRNDGTVWGWGANGTGQLGLGNTTDRPYATQIPNFGSIDRIAAGQYHVIAHSWGNRSVYGWGYNGYGQLGLGAGAPVIQKSPAQMSLGPNNMTEITDVAAGGYFSLMIRGRDEKVFVVGDNQSGQLAIAPNDTSARNLPVLSMY